MHLEGSSAAAEGYEIRNTPPARTESGVLRSEEGRKEGRKAKKIRLAGRTAAS